MSSWPKLQIMTLHLIPEMFMRDIGSGSGGGEFEQWIRVRGFLGHHSLGQ